LIDYVRRTCPFRHAPHRRLHLGHYHGVLKNWVKLQHEYPCLFFVADWHALTTHYDNPQGIEQATWDMVIDWLAAGVDPNQATCSSSRRCPSTPSCTCCCR
jgi:tryptophanyl-tRNA synthetase